MAEDRYLEALRQIARILEPLVQGEDTGDGGAGGGRDGTRADVGCRVMALPPRLQAKAAEVAARENPVNAPNQELAVVGGDGLPQPLALTVYTAKYWGPVPKTLSVSFVESTPADLRARIVAHLNAWAEHCGMSFAETEGSGDVRISREPGGYWSYLGTDIRLIPENRPTMNLEAFSMSTPESEFVRVVRHEAGHTLGFPHEHMRQALVDRIDPEKAYVYFQRTQGWSRQMVDQQVLTALDGWSIFGTEPDQDSIMCYQLPGSITKDGLPIRGGSDLTATDAAFAGVVYPKLLRTTAAAANGGGRSEMPATSDRPVAGLDATIVVDPGMPDWAPDEDVAVPA